ncbi:MAG: Ig-like domain repeat protein, partial [Acidobacteria bacterium]
VLTTPPTCASTASSSSPAGSTAPTACSGAAAPGYTIVYAPGVVTVTPAPLTITASSPSMTYGGVVPAVAPVYSGFVNGDTAAALTTEPTCLADATSATPAGTAATLCAGGAAANYSLAYAPGTLTISKAASTVALASSASSMGAGYGFTLTATVAPATSGTPSGTVSFFDGTTALGTATLTGGKASFTAKLAGLGTHDLTVQYGGDGNFSGGSSAAVAVNVVQSGYMLAATPDHIDVQRGSSGQIVITATPFGNFQGTVSFACSGLPSYASCAFTPPSLTLDGSDTQREMALTVTAAAAGGAPWLPAGGRDRWFWLLGALVVAGVAMSLRRRRVRLAWGLAGICLLLAGCGGMAAGNGSGNNTTGTTTQSATVKVTASANASAGSGGQTATVTLTITFD